MARRTHAYADDSRGPRLQRVLADAGIASRRECEDLIRAGVVTVNDEVVDSLPAWVDPARDRILVDGRPVRRKLEKFVYVMLHKPRGVVSTNRDPQGRPRAIDLVDHPSGARLFPVGRLDLDSSGLLLLTNDGELANRLTHPRYEVHKGYEVMVAGRLEEEDAKRLEAGIFLPERDPERSRRTARSHLVVLRRERDRTLLYMELREGRNRQIRRLMLRLGYPVKKLRRVQMGPLKLKGLGVGGWRELTAPELVLLRRAAHEQDAADPAGPRGSTTRQRRAGTTGNRVTGKRPAKRKPKPSST
ncbi:MAG: rRNA pseudouridine synthase [Phycisphaerales bacterium]|nr:rRNA pseudouridine synthase [Phycisphaerales bacterium]